MYLIYGCHFFFSFNTVTVLTRTTAKCTSWILNNGHKPRQLDHLWRNVTLQLCLYQLLTRLHCVLLKLVGDYSIDSKRTWVKVQKHTHRTGVQRMTAVLLALDPSLTPPLQSTPCTALRRWCCNCVWCSVAKHSSTEPAQEGCNGFKQQIC